MATKKALWVFVSIALLSAQAEADEIVATSLKLQKPEVVGDAPSFLLDDTDGNPRHLNDYKGKVILIHFWATWCLPCKEELPAIKTLWERFKDRGFDVVAIAGDRKDTVVSFIQRHEIKFPVLIDQYGSALRSYRVRGLPASYIVDRTGKIKGIATGQRDWLNPEAMDFIEDLLSK